MSTIKNFPSGLRGHACITTADGHPVSLTSLISGTEDIEPATSAATHGIGLFNTDFLFAGRAELPGEEEQLEIYKEVASKAGDRPVCIRTCSLCAGQIPGIETPSREKNPDLGLKGLRLGLEQPDILKTQLRAIARANIHGHIHLLLPMVSTPLEIKQLKKFLGDIQADLEREGIVHRPVTEIGIMADLPSVVVNAALFSFDASFFQVGNALKNYTMGVDFSADCFPHLQHDFEPTFLFQIKALADVVTKKNKTVSISAPLASLPEAIPILLALGVQDFVMHPGSMEPIKKLVENITIPKAKVIAAKAMSYWSGEDVQQYARDSLSKYLNI